MQTKPSTHVKVTCRLKASTDGIMKRRIQRHERGDQSRDISVFGSADTRRRRRDDSGAVYATFMIVLSNRRDLHKETYTAREHTDM